MEAEALARRKADAEVGKKMRAFEAADPEIKAKMKADAKVAVDAKIAAAKERLAGAGDEALEKKWEKLIAIRDEVNKALEIKRQERFVGNALEAKVTLFLNKEDCKLLNQYKYFLPALFIVSEAEIRNEPATAGDVYESTEVPGLSISVQRAAGWKCERCWNWSSKVGSFADAPQLCERCYNTIK